MVMTVIDEYLKNVSASHRVVLERVREIIKLAVPEAEETISYGIPAFKYKNKNLIYFAAFKNHMSVFPTAGPTESIKDKLTGFKVTKGTIQFTLDNVLPEPVLKELVAIRIREIDGK